MKRKIYLTISVLLSMIPIIPAFFIPDTNLLQKIFATILFYLCFAMVSVLVQIFTSLIINIPPENFKNIFLGILTLRMKKAFHSDLGEFFMSTEFKSDRAEVSIHEQKYFYIVKKFDMIYDGNIEDFKKRLKYRLEQAYREEHNEIKKQKELKDKWNKWSGAVDKQSDREMKLNELVK